MHTNQQGSALVTALFIVTIAAIIATAMLERLPLDIFRTNFIITRDRNAAALDLVQLWAIDFVRTLKDPPLPGKNGELAIFPKALQSKIALNGAIYDLQARYNLNNLAKAKSPGTFMNLLQQLLPEIPEHEQENLALALINWISPYHNDKINELLEQHYKKSNPPYQPPYQLMKNITEMRLVAGMNQTRYQQLLPFLTALPEATPININTASSPVLATLGDGLDTSAINTILSRRSGNGITKRQDLQKLARELNIPPKQITIVSKYYLCIAEAGTGENHLARMIILKKNGTRKVQIISDYR